MKLTSRCLLLLCTLAFMLGVAGCDLPKSDMAPDETTFLEQLNR
ncbi:MULTISPECIES: hypothetical protein [Nitrosococcus]|uniref:Lipoprotein n=1 Tax=Nitrosococcus watsoni (strain C-113) TaxID=105559 RepID=D8K9D7_NITWC|nr:MULTISPECIES: hypothetical protein [Nitrosococcus]ADJ29280.1 hypothetical protein Nwat_2483 [Nitrosococcus watsonii C-113]GEM19849.1 hypothetical protein NONS58_12470 [Nitrosococcus oceani]